MHFDILTLFPDIFEEVFNQSIVKRAREAGLVSIVTHNIRDYATDKHLMTDDTPYGGGGGMIMKPEPIFRAVEAILGLYEGQKPEVPVILLSPQGHLFTQSVARKLSKHPHLVLICGRYEGVDERVRQFLATDEISIGDYVLTGGEIPAMVIVDAVPEVLLSGNHAEIVRWRRQEALRRTFERRPDLLVNARLSQADREFLQHLAQEEGSGAEV
jgi:tRNA (guanine37-N1)-methyltransferase